MGPLSGVDDSCSLDLGDEWKNRRGNDPELESDETGEERVNETKKEALEKGKG